MAPERTAIGVGRGVVGLRSSRQDAYLREGHVPRKDALVKCIDAVLGKVRLPCSQSSKCSVHDSLMRSHEQSFNSTIVTRQLPTLAPLPSLRVRFFVFVKLGCTDSRGLSQNAVRSLVIDNL